MVAEANRFDYRAEFGSLYHGARRLPEHAEQWIAAVRAAKLRDAIHSSDRVLEYGVGFGWNLAALQCRDKVGFDITPELRTAVESKGIRFVQDENLIEEAHFDVVLCHHVLEHVKSPRACLQHVRSFLSAAGRLLLFVPFERERKYRRYKIWNKAHHLHSWTPASLRTLVESAGLRVRSVELQKFRFDRIAAVLASKFRAGFRAYQLLRSTGMLFFSEYEIALIAHNE